MAEAPIAAPKEHRIILHVLETFAALKLIAVFCRLNGGSARGRLKLFSDLVDLFWDSQMFPPLKIICGLAWREII